MHLPVLKMKGCADFEETLRPPTPEAEEGKMKTDGKIDIPIVQNSSSSLNVEPEKVKKMHPWLARELKIRCDDDDDAETKCAKKFKWEKVSKWKTISVDFEIKKDRKNGKPG